MHQNFDLDTLKHKIALQLHQDAYFFSSQNIERDLNFGFLIMRFCLLLLLYFNFRFNLSILFVHCRSCDENPRITSTFTERNVEKELVSE